MAHKWFVSIQPILRKKLANSLTFSTQELPGTLVSSHLHPLDQHAGPGRTEPQEIRDW